MSGSQSNGAQTVFVDLDRTLISVTSTHLQIRNFVHSHGLLNSTREVFRVRPRSRNDLKHLLASCDTRINYKKYVRKNVLDLIYEFDGLGYKIILATGSLESTGREVVRQLSIPASQVLGSTTKNRLKGKQKLQAITRLQSEAEKPQFIYVGDALVDLQVMRVAEESYFVGRPLVFIILRQILRTKRIFRIR